LTREAGEPKNAPMTRRLGGSGALLLALYLLALFGAPSAHGFLGADPSHADGAPHDPRLSVAGRSGAPDLHLQATCPVCRWYRANASAALVAPLLLAGPALSSPAAPPPSEPPVAGRGVRLPDARAPPAA